MVKESKLYPVVERWLKKYHQCFKGIRFWNEEVSKRKK